VSRSKLQKLDVRLVLVFVLSQVCVWTGCNAILGNGYGAFDETTGNGASPEGSAEGDALVGGEGGPGGDAMGSGDGNTADGNVDGGSCPRAMCPTTLTVAAGAQRIAVSAAAVYWTTAAGIGRVDQNGLVAKTLDLGGPIPANLKRGVAVSSTGVPYVTVINRGAASCLIDVSSCSNGFIGSAGLASSVAVDPLRVYVGIFDDQAGSMVGGIWQTDLSGATPLPYTMMTDKVLDLRTVAATTYFMTSAAVSFNMRTTAPVSAANLSGDAPVAFDVKDTTLVVATTNNHLRVCTMSPAASCATNLLQLRQTAISAVVVDGSSILWAEGGANGSIYRSSLVAGSNPELLAEGQASPSDIAVYGSSIYWANHGDGAGAGGAIMKLPK